MTDIAAAPAPAAAAPAPAPAPATAIAAVPKPPSAISSFTSRMLGQGAPAGAAPLAGRATYTQAASSIFGDLLTGGGVGALFGAAHARGWLDAGGMAVDGLTALFSGAIAVVTAPHYPTVSKYAARVASAGVTVFGFRKGFEVSSGGKPMLAGERVQVKQGEDRIAAVAQKYDLGFR